MKKDILFIVCIVLFIFALTGCTIGGEIPPNQLYETFQSGDFTANKWVRGGDLLPLMQSQFVQKGKYAVEFPAPGRQQVSVMYIDLDIEEDMVISFYVKTNFLAHEGALIFYVDDADSGKWFAVNDWKRVIRELPAGKHRLKWELYMDIDAGSDDTCVWLDNIMISKFIPLGEPIVFNDDAFKNYVRRIIGKRDDTSSSRSTLDQVYTNEVKDIELVVIYHDVTDITGLEHFTNLQSLVAFAEELADISPITNLQNIKEVEFSEMPISDISPLDTSAKSGSLKTLEFEDLPLSQASLDLMKTWDQIENLTMNFISLGTLDFLPSGNSLIKLDADYTDLTNIDGLTNQTNLTYLCLRCNDITDITPIVQGPINSLETVNIQKNYLDLTQGSEDMNNIQALIDAGILVYYEPQK